MKPVFRPGSLEVETPYFALPLSIVAFLCPEPANFPQPVVHIRCCFSHVRPSKIIHPSLYFTVDGLDHLIKVILTCVSIQVHHLLNLGEKLVHALAFGPESKDFLSPSSFPSKMKTKEFKRFYQRYDAGFYHVNFQPHFCQVCEHCIDGVIQCCPVFTEQDKVICISVYMHVPERALSNGRGARFPVGRGG